MAIPAIIAAVAAPIVGGAMSMIGGAMSLTGGVVHAGSTIAGIAADAAGGIMGAAGGLTGGGQSGQVKAKSGKMYDRDSPQGRTIVAAAKARKAKEGTSKGKGLASVKSTIDPDMMDESPTSLLPTGDESPTTLLGQILASIRGLYAPIESIAAGVISPPPEPTPPEDLIDTAQQMKGGDKEPGIVKRTFSALGTKLSDLSSSLGNTAKFIGKGLLLGGLFFLFKKYEKQITTMLASVFETLEGWYTGMKDPDSIFNNMSGVVEDTLMPWIKGIVDKIFELFTSAWNAIAEESWWLPKLPEILTTSVEETSASADSGTTLTAGTIGPHRFKQNDTSHGWVNEVGFENLSGTIEEKDATREKVNKRLKEMYAWFEKSKGTIQWTNIGDGFKLGQGPGSLSERVPIADIFSARPIINGIISTHDDLKNWSFTTPFGVNKEQYLKNLQEMTQATQMITAPHVTITEDVNGFKKRRKITPDRSAYENIFEAAEKANKQMILDKTSDSGTGQAVVVASNDNRNVNTHHGDFVFPKLDVHHSDSTATAFRQFLATDSMTA